MRHHHVRSVDECDVSAGFLITRPYMPPWWKWFSYICPPAWSIYAIVADQVGDKVSTALCSVSYQVIRVNAFVDKALVVRCLAC